MKNIKKYSVLLFITGFLISCNSPNHDLFNAISIRIPPSFKSAGPENTFVNGRKNASLTFTLTENKSFGNLLPRISFDMLYNQKANDSIMIQSKEIRKISDIIIGIVEKYVGETYVKTFFIEINDEILMGELRGKKRNKEFLNKKFERVIDSIKKK